MPVTRYVTCYVTALLPCYSNPFRRIINESYNQTIRRNEEHIDPDRAKDDRGFAFKNLSLLRMTPWTKFGLHL